MYTYLLIVKVTSNINSNTLFLLQSIVIRIFNERVLDLKTYPIPDLILNGNLLTLPLIPISFWSKFISLHARYFYMCLEFTSRLQ